MSNTTSTMTWETLQMGNDGRLSLQMGGEQLCLQATDDGKVEVVGADGKVKSIFDLVTVIDPTDPKVIEVAKTACKEYKMEFQSVIIGVKVSVLLGAVYCLIISAKDSAGAPKVFFTAVFESFFKRLVLLFFCVPLPF